MTNEELALRIQAGERELLELLWERTHKLIYALLKRMLRRNSSTQAPKRFGGFSGQSPQNKKGLGGLGVISLKSPPNKNPFPKAHSHQSQRGKDKSKTYSISPERIKMRFCPSEKGGKGSPQAPASA